MQWFHRRSTKCGRGRRTNSARISHPPPFRRVTKNIAQPILKKYCPPCHKAGIHDFNLATKSSVWIIILDIGTQQSKRRNVDNGLRIVVRNSESTHIHP